MCVGQGSWEDELLDSTRQMDALLKEKDVPAWIDYWGFDSAHDWAWWRKQIVYFIDKLLAPDWDYVNPPSILPFRQTRYTICSLASICPSVWDFQPDGQ